MKITLLNNAVIYILVNILLLCSCGISKDAYYKNAKTYGQTQTSSDSHSNVGTSSDHTEQQDTSEYKENLDSNDNNHNDINQILNITNNDLTFNKKYIGFADTSSLKIIFKNGYNITPTKYTLINNFILKLIKPDDALLNLIYKINIENNSESTFYQKLYTTLGDLGTYLNHPSESGTYLFRRTIKDTTCPNVFICVDKMIFYPKEGDAIGFCYYHEKTFKPAAFPYAPLPNIKSQDFEPYIQNYFGPYVVKIVENPSGLSFSCDLSNVKEKENKFYKLMVMVTMYAPSTIESTHIPKTLGSDFVLNFSNTMFFANNNVQSDIFIDDILKLQELTEFYFNQNEGIIYRITKTVNKTLKYLENNDSLSIGGVYNVLNPIKGISINCDFILCDVLKSDSNFKSRCE